MKEELIPDIKIKIAISLNKLLDATKNFRPSNNNDEEIAKSYNKIALASFLRKATVSDIFNAKSKTTPTCGSLFLIIEAMGYTLSDFAKIYDSVTTIDIKDFKQPLNKRQDG
ncbi:hypothetical protein QSE00_19515 [Arenibacter sp. M-2]|uniref:hypothetical protein n=1 Tax=Arenibacter sp. M-2 TaxID=3053612 RepID=UPI00257094A3|nr:hypothetical protein [Arenibacter sp. M-2]MDL5514013.1 hypothetical protein [Arenibacter sp. M-2]